MEKLKEYLLINTGLFLVAFGIVIFKIPNKFATGGVSGLAIILNKFIVGKHIGFLMMLLNTILVVIGFLFLGKKFGVRTFYASIAMSGMVWVLEKLIHITKPLTNDTLLELVYAIALPAIGSAIVFNNNGSTGGTDIVAKLLSRKAHLDIGKTLLLADFIITLSALAILGIKSGMYSILGLVIKGLLIDFVIEGLNVAKRIEIISERSEEIGKFILEEIGRGATIYKVIGGYTGKEMNAVMVVTGRNQAYRLRQFVYNLDPLAFVIITNTSEIIGKGFRNTGEL